MHRWSVLLLMALLVPATAAQQPDLFVHTDGAFQPGEAIEIRYGNEGTTPVSGDLVLTVRHQDDAAGTEARFQVAEPAATLAAGEQRTATWTPPSDAPEGTYSVRVEVGEQAAFAAFILAAPKDGQQTPPAPPKPEVNTPGGFTRDEAGHLYVAGDTTVGFQKTGSFYDGDHVRFTYLGGTLAELKAYHEGRDPLLLSRLTVTPAPEDAPTLRGPALVHASEASAIEVHDHPRAFLNIDLSDGASATLDAPFGASWSQQSPRTYVLRGGDVDATLSIIDLVTTEWSSPDGSGGGRQDRVTVGLPHADVETGESLRVAATGDITLAVTWGGSDDDALTLAEHVSTGFLSGRIHAGASTATLFPYAYMQGTAYLEARGWTFDLAPSNAPHGLVAITVDPEVADPDHDEGVQVLANGEVVGDARTLDELVAAYHRGERGFWVHQVGDQYEVVYADPSGSGQQLQLQSVAIEPVQTWIAGRTVGLAIGAGAAILLAVVSLTRRDRF